MEVSFSNSQSEKDFKPAEYPYGTIFNVKHKDVDVVVVKVNDELYVAIGAGSDNWPYVTYSPTWFIGWENPRVLEKGESFTVTV